MTSTGSPATSLAPTCLAFVSADGSAVHAAVPLTACHKPQPAVLTALDALDTGVVSTTKQRQVLPESDAAAVAAFEASGVPQACSPSCADQSAMRAGMSLPASVSSSTSWSCTSWAWCSASAISAAVGFATLSP